MWTCTCHCTSDGKEHKTIWLAGPEQDTIFHLCFTVCREQGSDCHDERLACNGYSFTGAGDFVLQIIRLESFGSELQFVPVAHHVHYTDRKQPLIEPK